jgi:2-dehydropantoate 2-reductase
MKIAILGSGSIGLYYGAKLAGAGEDVHFLMRSGYDQARREGIRVRSPEGDLHLASPQVANDVHDIGPVDLVLIALKVTDNAMLTELVPPLLNQETALLTLQNGLGNEEFLAGHFGVPRVLGGLCFVCLTRDTPASVEHFGHGTLSIGEFGERGISPRLRDITGLFLQAGVETHPVDALIQERWRKLVWNIPFNGLSVAAGQKSVDEILASQELFNHSVALMHEVITIANALGHEIPRDFADKQIARTRSMGAYKPSTLVDHLAGRPLEIETLWGEPLRQAKAAGVESPHLEALYERLVVI